MVRTIPDPIETYIVWQAGNSIQRIARDPTPLVGGAPYGHIDVLAALRQAEDITENLGPELITDPTFEQSLDWAQGAGWTVAAGPPPTVAECDGTQASASDLLNSGSTTENAKTYSTYIVIDEVSAGGVQVEIGTVLGTLRTTPGTYEENILTTVGGSVSRLQADPDFVGKVSVFSVREVLP